MGIGISSSKLRQWVKGYHLGVYCIHVIDHIYCNNTTAMPTSCVSFSLRDLEEHDLIKHTHTHTHTVPRNVSIPSWVTITCRSDHKY